MTFLRRFWKKEPVLLLSLLAALLSALSGAPLAAYPGYIDWGVLALLLCLMATVAGLTGAGLLGAVAAVLPKRFRTARTMGLALMAACFFGSMLFTNDVSLLAFVPLALLLFGPETGKTRIVLVCAMAVSANLGSLVTPVGNPQNLFLYTYYQMDAAAFFAVMLPLGAVCLTLCALLSLLLPCTPVAPRTQDSAVVRKPLAVLYGALFAFCLLAVFRVIPKWVCLLVTAGTMAIADRQRFAKVDWSLLLTFVCFFVFSGNLQQIPAVSRALQALLAGRECLVGALCSQVISNVPAAVLLAPSTGNAAGLLRGVNIGGLGTPVASLASLIAYRLYARSEGAASGPFFVVFLAMNAALLAVLLLIFAW